MKIRNGFVSNSSSSSFVIIKDKLDRFTIDSIHNHIEMAKKYSKYIQYVCPEDEWNISEDDMCIEGSTHMDNFDMHTFLIDILRIPSENIKWGD